MNNVVTEVKAAADRARRGAARIAFWITAYPVGAFAGEPGCGRRRTTSRRHLDRPSPRPAPLALSGSRKGRKHAILLWLLGNPIPIIILLVLLLRTRP